MSTSGRSPNILAAQRVARYLGLETVGFTGGADNPMRKLCHLCLAEPTDETALIQQIHDVVAHVISGLVEENKERPRIDGPWSGTLTPALTG